MANRRNFEDEPILDDIEISVENADVKKEDYYGINNGMTYETASTYMKNMEKGNPIYTARLLSSSNTNTLDLQRLNTLCENPQGDINKVLEIASHARRLANMSDLHGKIYEAIENNTNPSYKIIYPQNSDGEKGKKKYDKAISEIQRILNEKLFSVNDIDSLIASDVVPTAYLEGNKILNMRRTKKGYYSIESYPVGIAEISDYMYHGENIVMINVESLRKGLESLGIKDKRKMKENEVGDLTKELQQYYPEEVYKAYTGKEKYAKLNPMTTGVIRNKNMGGKYGVSSFLPSFKSHIQLETIDASDNINTKARAKKFVVQTMYDKLSGTTGRDKHFVEMNFANENLFQAASRELVVVTTPATVKDVQLMEFKNSLTPIANINYYRYQSMNALGIGFLSAETNSKFTATQVSFQEIIRTINKLNRQLSAYLNKCIYYIVNTENSKLADYCPRIEISDAQWLDNELRIKLSTYLFTMLGSSYQTAYGLLGLDADEEKRLREKENELGYNEVFKPRASVYTTNGNDTTLDEEEKTQKTEENQNPDKDVQADDKARTENNQ